MTQTDAQFLKSAGIASDWSAMNELHQIQILNIEEAHEVELAHWKQRVEWREAIQIELLTENAKLRRRLDYWHLALFACACVIAYLVGNR